LFVIGVAAPAASAAPPGLAQQGRFIDDKGLPLTGPHSLTVALYDTPLGGTPLWTETQAVVLDLGYYGVILGTDTQNPLSEDILAQYPLWLGVRLDDGAEFTPRHELVSVPYSHLATTSVNIEGGYVDASHVEISGSPVIASDGRWVGPPIDTIDTLEALSCTGGQLVKFDGASWRCADELDPLGAIVCSPGQLLGKDAVGWRCVDRPDPLGAIPCAPGQILGKEAVGWRCFDLPDPLGSIPCGQGQLLAKDGNAWRCVDVPDPLGGIPCGQGQLLAKDGNAWRCVDAPDPLGGIPCGQGQLLAKDGNAWRCVDVPDPLGGIPCGVGQLLARDATGWQCIDVPDPLRGIPCAPGQLLARDAAGWRCVDPTVYGGDDFALANQACPAGWVAVGIDVSGGLICVLQTADITGVTAGAGLVGGGTSGDVQLAVAFGGNGGSALVAHADHNHNGKYLPTGGNLSCGPGFVVTSIDAGSGSVVCSPDEDTKYTAGAGLAQTGTTFSVVYGPGGSANQAVRSDDPRLNNDRPPAPGSNNYIQNQFGAPQPANFNISGQGAMAILNVEGGYVYMGGRETIRNTDSWMRLNQGGHFPSGVHTPGLLAPSSLNVGGANGWGNPGGGNMWVAGGSVLYGPVTMPSCRVCFYYADEKGDSGRRTMCMRFEPGNWTGWMRLAGDVDSNDQISMKYLCDNGPSGVFDGWPWL
jgi:hypothetical protein